MNKRPRAHLYILSKNGAIFDDSFRLDYHQACRKQAFTMQQRKLHFPCADKIGYPFVDLIKTIILEGICCDEVFLFSVNRKEAFVWLFFIVVSR